MRVTTSINTRTSSPWERKDEKAQQRIDRRIGKQNQPKTRSGRMSTIINNRTTDSSTSYCTNTKRDKRDVTYNMYTTGSNVYQVHMYVECHCCTINTSARNSYTGTAENKHRVCTACYWLERCCLECCQYPNPTIARQPSHSTRTATATAWCAAEERRPAYSSENKQPSQVLIARTASDTPSETANK